MGNTIVQWRVSIGNWLRGMLHLTNTRQGIVNTPSLHWFTIFILAVILIIGGVELNPGPKVSRIEPRSNLKYDFNL
ncbi:hypothetical protein L9F63_026655 [Diploptera punctata]|uniref:Uncharacterized protein n=1 Tax=Diploptera punctata TaxID=6984 RepID=A0AAD8EPX0_DIPPU|nr:hypothetical protein L9F63_026655 [Diploptera punctata]